MDGAAHHRLRHVVVIGQVADNAVVYLLADIVRNVAGDAVVYPARHAVFHTVADVRIEGVDAVLQIGQVTADVHDGIVDLAADGAGDIVGNGVVNGTAHHRLRYVIVVGQIVGHSIVNLAADIIYNTVVDGIADKVRDVACVACLQGVWNCADRCESGRDGHRTGSRVVGDGSADGGIRPVDVRPRTGSERAAAYHQGEQAVGVGRKPGVVLAVPHHRAVGLAHFNQNRNVVLTEHQLVLCVAHHRLVG